MIGERRHKKNIESLDFTRKVNLLIKALTWKCFCIGVNYENVRNHYFLKQNIWMQFKPAQQKIKVVHTFSYWSDKKIYLTFLDF